MLTLIHTVHIVLYIIVMYIIAFYIIKLYVITCTLYSIYLYYKLLYSGSPELYISLRYLEGTWRPLGQVCSLLVNSCTQTWRGYRYLVQCSGREGVRKAYTLRACRFKSFQFLPVSININPVDSYLINVLQSRKLY